jgi:hypothetical protein
MEKLRDVKVVAIGLAVAASRHCSLSEPPLLLGRSASKRSGPGRSGKLTSARARMQRQQNFQT